MQNTTDTSDSLENNFNPSSVRSDPSTFNKLKLQKAFQCPQNHHRDTLYSEDQQ